VTGKKLIIRLPISLPDLAPDRVRVSVGTAAVLGLLHYRLQVPPTTSYIMTFTEETCLANCSFCAQARDNVADKTLLSRVIWPDFSLINVVNSFNNPAMKVLERICVQVINYSDFISDTLYLVSLFKEKIGLPVSVDICPVDSEVLTGLKAAGADRISIPLDASTPTLFDAVKGRAVKGPYRWDKHMAALKEAVEVFGEFKVGSNIIIGLGESEMDAVKLIQKLYNMGVSSILFAFTPLKGTRLQERSQPIVESYRRIQVARHLITRGRSRVDEMSFDHEGRLTGFGGVDLYEELADGVAFMTTGCPGCNRPFYNERPSGPFYNYPRNLTARELKMELRELGLE
jgi:biotin synthase-related radical SAM superfamily protein